MSKLDWKWGNLILLLILAVGGMVLLLVVTSQGIGTSPDAVSYIGAADSLLAGEGLSSAYGRNAGQPFTFRAPLYPLLLAGASLTGLPPASSARWVNALIYGANIFLVGLLVYSSARQRSWLPVVAGAFILTALPILIIHAYAWSEPLFLLLTFSGLWLLAVYLDNGRYLLLFLSATLLGLAVLARYAGLPLILTGAAGIFLFATWSLRRRFLDALLFGVVSTLPYGLWVMRNAQLTGSASAREFAFHPIGMTHFWQAVFTLTDWLHLPDGTPGIVRVLVLLLAGGGLTLLFWWVYRGKNRLAIGRQSAVPHLLKLLLLFTVLYLLFLAISISFFDANTPLDERILSPLYFVGIILLITVLARLWPRVRRRAWVTAVLLMVGFLFLFTAVRREYPWATQSAQQGIGFSSLAWQQSALIAWARYLPAETPLFSNSPDAIYLQTGRSALPIPKQINTLTQTATSSYTADLAEMQEQVTQQTGVIIFFTNIQPNAQTVTAELEEAMPLQVVLQTRDGIIYVAEQP